MPSSTYSFIDIAVLDEVRQRFAAGDALAILSIDLDEVIWANGPGAAIFGYPDIEAIIGASTQLTLVARRQIMATAGYPNIGQDKSLLVRLATGMTSQAVSFLASAIILPDGEKAILLAVPAARTASRSEQERAEQAIGGLNEPGHFAALVDATGTAVAAPEGFDAIGITTETLAGLVAEVRDAGDRLVKRLIPAKRGRLPAGFARLVDDPALHLLVVVDEVEDAVGSEPNREVAGSERADDDNRAAAPAVEAAAPAETSGEFAAPTDKSAAPGEDHGLKPANLSDADERWYFNTDRTTPVEPPVTIHQDNDVEPAAPLFERETAPVRFVWRTDAEGNFSAISPEFAHAVGEAAADIVGRKFREVATRFGFDPNGEIAGLLERRDTWSGRSVLWPVSGTDLRIPVDLAALPIYGRDRDFEGFRGFGVARGGDAVADPDALGLALVQGKADDSASKPAETDRPDIDNSVRETGPDKKSLDPFKGEVPALAIVPKPERRFTDKVIRLAEHRTPANDKGLTPLERNAFREIGDRLKKESAAKAEKPSASPAGDVTGSDKKPDEATPRAGGETSMAPATAAGEPEQDDAIDTPAPVAEWPSETEVPPMPDAVDETPPATEATVEAPAGDASAEAVEPRPGSSADKLIGRMAERVTADEAKGGADHAPPAAEQSAPAETEAGVAREADQPVGPVDEAGEAPSATPATSEPAGPAAPELRTSGFLPSAFPTSDGERVPADTSILAKLPVPVLIHSGDRLHYANDEFLALTGYDTIEDLADSGGLDTLFGEPYEEGADASGNSKLRLLTRDGEEFPVEARLQSVPWNGGKALLLALSRSDTVPSPERSDEQGTALISQAEQSELEDRIAEMRAIVDTATDGVVLIANDGSIRSISRAAEALFGFDDGDVAGKPFVSLFAIESQRAARDYLTGLSEHGVASVLNDGREVIGREAQGRFIPLFMTIGRLPNDSGYCAVVRDITQWKRAEEELTQARAQAERASSQKTDFLARVSHEIRTPLNAIIGFSELMIDEKFGPVGNDRYRDYLRDINRSGNHVLDLVNDLLDISKIEAGEQEMAYEAVSLNDTLSETVAMMQPQANRERVIIRSSFASRLPEVVADLRSVRQIALNLLSNAVRYTQAGGQVIVSTAYEPSGDIVMRVRDTGIGMSQAEIEQALKPFKQINALKRGRNDGTGLGLPLTKAMVEANRAKFSIVSTPGEGTLVEITFPSTRVLAD